MNDDSLTPETTSARRRCLETGLPRYVVAVEVAEKLERERDEAAKELRQISSLMFGGILEDTRSDGLAWRVYNEVIALKKEADELREKYRMHHAEADRLTEVVRAATVLIAAKGRHNTMLAYQGLRAALFPENVQGHLSQPGASVAATERNESNEN